jgi:uncharacterized protein
VIAVDSNVLVAAHRAEMEHHGAARTLLQRLTQGRAPWALPLPVVAEFLRVVTHPGARPPTPLGQAVSDIDALLDSPSARLLRPTERFWLTFRETATEAAAAGRLIHDAQIIALCVEHGADTIVSEDRGLRRFRGIEVLTIEEAC